jgi:hypothetical protein
VEVSLASELPGEGKMHGVRNCRVLAPALPNKPDCKHALARNRQIVSRANRSTTFPH